jgi:hypothetical protein
VSDTTTDVNAAAARLNDASDALRAAANKAANDDAWKNRESDLVGLEEQAIDLRQQIEMLKLLRPS